MEPSRIQAIDHVNLQAPPGVEGALRWFYGEVAMLRGTADGQGLSNVVSFRSERIEVRIWVVEEPKIDPVRSRVTIGVSNLEEAVCKLVESGYEVERISGLMFSDRRIATLDPAGNRVILKQHWAVGPL